MADNKKNLKYFMRSMEPEVVTAPGLDSIRDENGEIIPFEIKVLSQEEINKINEAYRKRSMATDKKGNPLIAMGEVVWKTEKDSARASRHLIVEALQFPNLKDPELMAHVNAAQGLFPGGRVPARLQNRHAGPRPRKPGERRRGA